MRIPSLVTSLCPCLFGARETTHRKLNADLGLPDDPATKELFTFLSPLTGAEQ